MDDIDRELAGRILAIIRKHAPPDTTGRGALVYNAWMGSPLLQSINYEGNRYEFSTHLYQRGKQYGLLDDGQHALAALLTQIATLAGPTDRDEIAKLNQQLATLKLRNGAGPSGDANRSTDEQLGQKRAKFGRSNRLLRDAHRHLEAREYRQAIAAYTQFIDLNPDVAEVYKKRGDAYAGLKQYQQAVADFTKAISLNTNFPLIHYRRGVANYRLRQYKQAIEDFTATLNLEPEYGNAYHYRGIAHTRLRQYREAIDDFKTATRLDKNNPTPHRGLGDAYYEIKRYPEAIAAYEEYARLAGQLHSYMAERIAEMQRQRPAPDPPSERAIGFFEGGKAYSEANRHDMAVHSYGEAIHLAPGYIDAYLHRARAHTTLRQFEEAIDDYHEAIRLDPALAHAYWELGNLYYDTKHYKEAIAAYRGYERLNGSLERFMRYRIAEMEANLGT